MGVYSKRDTARLYTSPALETTPSKYVSESRISARVQGVERQTEVWLICQQPIGKAWCTLAIGFRFSFILHFVVD